MFESESSSFPTSSVDLLSIRARTSAGSIRIWLFSALDSRKLRYSNSF